eukprot:gene11417-8124_t
MMHTFVFFIVFMASFVIVLAKRPHLRGNATGLANNGSNSTTIGPAARRHNTPSNQTAVPITATTNTSGIPEGFNKTIFMLWFQGFDEAPEVVQHCRQSWVHYNPTWKIVFLDNDTLPHYLPTTLLTNLLPNRATMLPAHISDVIRVHLLSRYGGVWADATLFCNRPLDDWLHGKIGAGFFAFAKPAPGRPLSNWFLYGSRGNYLLTQWANATATYHAQHPQCDDYFIQHHLFDALYKSDKRFHTMWDAVPKVAVRHGPHYLLEMGYFNNVTDVVKEAIDSKNVPLYKLSWKDYVVSRQSMTNIDYLFSTVPSRS